MHCVAISRRLNRQRLLVYSEPTAKRVRRIIQQAEGGEHLDSSDGSVDEQHASVDPELVLDWLDAGRFLRAQANLTIAAGKFARLFARTSGQSADAMMERLDLVDPSVIRRARVRADVVAMNLHRLLMGKYS